MNKLLKLIKITLFNIGLKDSPNKLKKHEGEIPLIGGLLYLIIILASSFIISFNNYSNIYLLIILIVIGIWDDIKNLNPNVKFFLTLLCLLCIVSLDKNLQINLLNFEYINNIYFPNNKFLNIFIPIICLMLLLNSFNMIDGINGLAGTIFLSWSFYLILNNLILINILLPFIFGIIIFLYFNFKNKAFLGDGGNYALSMIIGTIIIVQNNVDSSILSAEEIFLLLMIPGVDMFRLFILRLYKKKNPFKGDRNHLHHYLFNKYGLQKSLLIYLILINGPLYIYLIFNINLLFLVMINLFFYFLIIRISVLKKM